MSQNTTQIQEQPTFEVPFERGCSRESAAFCTCTTTFYPDGDKMIPEKHVCLRCYEEKKRSLMQDDGDELDAAHYERTDYEEGYLDGKDTAEQQLTQVLKEEREKTAISVQEAYDKGKIEGAEALREDFHIFEKKVAELEKKNAELRKKMNKMYNELMHNELMYNELQDDLEKKDKEIKNLRTQLDES